MAERLTFDPFSPPGLEAKKPTVPSVLPSGLFDELFAPGSVFRGTFGFGAGGEQMVDPVALLKRGDPSLGLKPWESLFDAQGRVVDPEGLLRALNVGSILSRRPRSEENLLKDIGYDPSSSVPVGSSYALPGLLQPPGATTTPPTPFGAATGFPPPSPQAVARQSIDNLYKGLPPDLAEWLKLVSGGNAVDDGGLLYDPRYARFTDYRLGGVDIRNATLDELNQAARELYGVDLLTLAASPTELLAFRKRALENPDLVFDPVSQTIKVTRVPGLREEDFAARVEEFQQALQRSLAEAQQNLLSFYNSAQLAATLPEYRRSAFAQMLFGLAPLAGSAGQAASDLQSKTGTDTGFLFQTGINPYALDAALSRLRLGV